MSKHTVIGDESGDLMIESLQVAPLPKLQILPEPAASARQGKATAYADEAEFSSLLGFQLPALADAPEFPEEVLVGLSLDLFGDHPELRSLLETAEGSDGKPPQTTPDVEARTQTGDDDGNRARTKTVVEKAVSFAIEISLAISEIGFPRTARFLNKQSPAYVKLLPRAITKKLIPYLDNETEESSLSANLNSLDPHTETLSDDLAEIEDLLVALCRIFKRRIVDLGLVAPDPSSIGKNGQRLVTSFLSRHIQNALSSKDSASPAVLGLLRGLQKLRMEQADSSVSPIISQLNPKSPDAAITQAFLRGELLNEPVAGASVQSAQGVSLHEILRGAGVQIAPTIFARDNGPAFFQAKFDEVDDRDGYSSGVVAWNSDSEVRQSSVEEIVSRRILESAGVLPGGQSISRLQTIYSAYFSAVQYSNGKLAAGRPQAIEPVLADLDPLLQENVASFVSLDAASLLQPTDRTSIVTQQRFFLADILRAGSHINHEHGDTEERINQRVDGFEKQKSAPLQLYIQQLAFEWEKHEKDSKDRIIMPSWLFAEVAGHIRNALESSLPNIRNDDRGGAQTGVWIPTIDFAEDPINLDLDVQDGGDVPRGLNPSEQEAYLARTWDVGQDPTHITSSSGWGRSSLGWSDGSTYRGGGAYSGADVRGGNPASYGPYSSNIPIMKTWGDPPGAGLAFDTAAAVKFLLAHCEGGPTGYCQRYVRNALVAAGLDVPRFGGAKEMVGYLANNPNFSAVASGLGNQIDGDYKPQVGDIMVYRGTDSKRGGQTGTYGHIQMCVGFRADGSAIWMSDFASSENNPSGLRDPVGHGGELLIFRQHTLKPAPVLTASAATKEDPTPVVMPARVTADDFRRAAAETAQFQGVATEIDNALALMMQRSGLNEAEFIKTYGASAVDYITRMFGAHPELGGTRNEYAAALISHFSGGDHTGNSGVVTMHGERHQGTVKLDAPDVYAAKFSGIPPEKVMVFNYDQATLTSLKTGQTINSVHSGRVVDGQNLVNDPTNSNVKNAGTIPPGAWKVVHHHSATLGDCVIFIPLGETNPEGRDGICGHPQKMSSAQIGGETFGQSHGCVVFKGNDYQAFQKMHGDIGDGAILLSGTSEQIAAWRQAHDPKYAATASTTSNKTAPSETVKPTKVAEVFTP